MDACIFLITHIEDISDMRQLIFDKGLSDLKEGLFGFLEKSIYFRRFIEAIGSDDIPCIDKSAEN